MSDEIAHLRIRVGDLEKSASEIKTLLSMRDERQKDIYDKVAVIYGAIVGNVQEGVPGILTKLDRLEQAKESENIHRAWIYSIICGLSINAIWHWIVGHG